MKYAPKLVRKLTQIYGAWVVGSAADLRTNLETVADWDIVVPFSEWHFAAQLIPAEATPNSFGGWKCVSEGKSVDVWPDDMTLLLTNPLCRYLWHPRSGVRWEKLHQ